MTFGSYEDVIRDWSAEEREQFPESCFKKFETISSTNTLLRERLNKKETGHFGVIVADHQTAGRGRRGDRWEASKGSNLLFSLALRLPSSPTTWTRLPHLAAMVVGSALESILREVDAVEAKWPNDLLVGGKKLCGILVETTTVPEPFAIVGIGLNVNMRRDAFPNELQSVATSVAEIEGCEANREYLLGLILQGFLAHYPSALTEFSSIHEWYRERDFLFGKAIEVETLSGRKKGNGAGLGENGELFIELASGETEKVISAEKILLC